MSTFKTHLKVTEDNKIRFILNIYLRTIVRVLAGMPAQPHTIKEDLYRECKVTPKLILQNQCCFTQQTKSIVVTAAGTWLVQETHSAWAERSILRMLFQK